jgi:hypothetical protein
MQILWEGLRGVKPFPHCSQTPSRSYQAGFLPTIVGFP